MIEVGREAGQIKADEGTMLRRVFEFTDRTAAEVMVPRQQVVALDRELSKEEMLRIVTEEGYTRLPVYEGTLDKIIGIVHAKDLLSMLIYEELIVLSDLIRGPFYVRDTDKISEVLRQLRRRKMHMAIVRDDNHKVVGIITMEDILEEIVGEIADEHDVKEVVE
jgi:CBS domain containing-hemolysin-like protein